MKVSQEVRDIAAGVVPNEAVEGLGLSKASSEAEAGMAAMGRKFRALGGEIEVKVE